MNIEAKVLEINITIGSSQAEAGAAYDQAFDEARADEIRDDLRAEYPNAKISVDVNEGGGDGEPFVVIDEDDFDDEKKADKARTKVVENVTDVIAQAQASVEARAQAGEFDEYLDSDNEEVA